MDPEILRIVDAARAVWIRRLIDHSRANSLLFYRDLRVGTLDLTGRTEVVARLLAGESLAVESLADAGPEAPGQDPLLRAQAESEARDRVRHSVIALQRKALSNLEEKGIETLHLAQGMATWPATDGGRPYLAPVLLLPARIELRGRSGDDVRLLVDGEPRLNPVLAHVLEENHGLRIGEAAAVSAFGSEDDAGHWRVDAERLFSSIRSACTAVVPGFEVQQRVVLANFQFAKMAMVEDLRRNGAALASSAVVSAIAGHPASRQELAQALSTVEPFELDEQPASDDYLVLDADSTQQRAIVSVGKGHNGVVQGAPGTGKSQTIANLIAQSVANGRRVLFVAEKRAALDAVIKRLSHPDVDLGHLVLDLHGASVSRKEVMARLAQALEQIRHAQPVQGAEAVHREFEVRRKQLNEHARRVNTPRRPTGLSVNRIIGRLLRLPASARSALRIRGELLLALTPERAEEVRRWMVDAAAHPTLLLGTDPSPWNDARIPDGRRAQEALDLAGTAAAVLWPALERQLDAVVRQIGVRLPATLAETGALLGVLRDVRRVREHCAAEVFASRPGELARALAPATRGLPGRAWAFLCNAGYRAARKRLLALRTSPAATATLRDEALRAEDALRRWRELGAASEVPVEAAGEAQLATAFAALSEATTALGALTGGASFADMPFPQALARVTALVNDQRTPYRLPGVYELRSRLGAAGLDRLLDDLRESGVAPEHWAVRFEYVWLYSALEHALSSDPGLAGFDGRTHEQIVAEFKRLDVERVRLAADRVRRLHGERAIGAMNQRFEQANLVKAEAHKKSRHIPLRELLARAPDVLTHIAPCWVASPLSVSQLLDAGAHFDLVLFDEASQVLQEEAIPALYRARQVVVAGDRHQLPPTTFFATVVEGEDQSPEEDEELRNALATATAAIGGFESLLGTLEAFLPNWLLEWHYRSEDERLIAFSNAHIYTGRLVTFPSAREQQALRHVLVQGDPAVGSRAESSASEVQEVVRQVLRHAETRPHESLGVITMGIQHANRVQAALDRALESRSELSDFFSLDRQERFFVKNLENVQGDERDAILLSIGYGKTADGQLPHHFGPLTHEAGYRRLNVAVTRAKRRICVISSFSHHDVDLDRSGSRGVQLLKAYLEYAASGGTRLPLAEHAGEVDPHAFEADLREALEARGIPTRARFGASRCRIDLVAMHPGKPGRPVLAIECDGASYHSNATARDRDRLRQAHLERLGWRFHRIWSTDWFYGRERETQRAVEAYGEAVRRAELSDAEVAQVPPPSAFGAPSVERTPQSSAPRQRGPRPRVSSHASIDQFSDRELRQIAEWVASDGLLRTEEELIRDIFGLLPFKRLGDRIRTRLMAVAREG